MKYCGDCLAKEGELHEIGCDMERCIKCGNQKIQCSCGYEIEREPYFDTCFCCERCGEKMPKLFGMDTNKWEQICGVIYSYNCVLCLDCVKFIAKKRVIDIGEVKI